MNTSKRIMLMIGVVILGAFIAMMIPLKKQPSLQFEPLENQFLLLKRAHEKWFAPNDLPDNALTGRILCEWFDYKSKISADAPDWDESLKQLQTDVMDLVTETSIRSIFWIGEKAFDTLKPIYENDGNAKNSLLAQCKEFTPNLDKTIDSEIEDFQTFAKRENIIDGNFKILPQKLDVARLLHRRLWNDTMSEDFSRNRIESPEERLAVFRWLVESSALPPADKIKKLDNAPFCGPQYDCDFAAAVLYAQIQNFSGACRALHNDVKNHTNDNFRKNRAQNAIHELSQAFPNDCSLNASHSHND